MDELFNELAKWGMLGHSSGVVYGITVQDEKLVMGWTCVIQSYSMGSVSIGWGQKVPSGFHPTDVHSAIRVALRQAAEMWPDTAEKVQAP